MLETLSININPSVQMTLTGTQVFLKDDLWQQLLGRTKYRITGDERWLIGENDAGEIVVLHFDRDVVVKKCCPEKDRSNNAFIQS